jgi:hypothetical protein
MNFTPYRSWVSLRLCGGAVAEKLSWPELAEKPEMNRRCPEPLR